MAVQLVALEVPRRATQTQLLAASQDPFLAMVLLRVSRAAPLVVFLVAAFLETPQIADQVVFLAVFPTPLEASLEGSLAVSPVVLLAMRPYHQVSPVLFSLVVFLVASPALSVVFPMVSLVVFLAEQFPMPRPVLFSQQQLSSSLSTQLAPKVLRMALRPPVLCLMVLEVLLLAVLHLAAPPPVTLHPVVPRLMVLAALLLADLLQAAPPLAALRLAVPCLMVLAALLLEALQMAPLQATPHLPALLTILLQRTPFPTVLLQVALSRMDLLQTILLPKVLLLMALFLMAQALARLLAKTPILPYLLHFQLHRQRLPSRLSLL